MNRLLALDLFCGMGGWANGLSSAGWDIIGFDTEYQKGYYGDFIQADVREVSGYDFPGASLVVASPPCQEFSYRHLPFGRVKKLPPPSDVLWRAAERIARECGAPLVLENVIGAQKFMGKAKAHYGSFYLWGDVPALLPEGNPAKGFQSSRAIRFGKNRDEYLKIQSPARFGSKSKQRKEWSANAAVIPFELARWIGQCFHPGTKQ